MTNRTQALSKMFEKINIHGKILQLLKAFLNPNILQIVTNDNETIHITQTIGVPQGNCLSATNFIIDTADLFDNLRNNGVEVGGYADDIAFYHTNPELIQNALRELHTWCLRNGMVVNVIKTKMMKFRGGGRLKKTDGFEYDGQKISIVNTFTYLGVTFQSSGTTFTKHIESRLAQIASTQHVFNDLHLLSITNALNLFYMKLAPIMEYGIKALWTHLTTTQLQDIDKALTGFLKKVCRLARNSKNRIVLTICDTPSFVNAIKKKYNLPDTPSYETYVSILCEKMQGIDSDLFTTPSMP